MGPDLQRGISPMVGGAASQPGGRGFDSRSVQVRFDFLHFLMFFKYFLDMSGIAWGVFWDALGCFLDSFGRHFSDTFWPKEILGIGWE